MKKTVALIITICMVFCAFSPVVVKAASSGFWYFSQADNNITEWGSNYLSQYFPQLIHADDDVATVQQYFDEIRSQYPDLSYILTNSSNGLPNEEVITSGNRLSVMFFDSQDITIAYKGSYSTTDLMGDPHQQLSDASWGGWVNVISVTEEMPDSFHAFTLNTEDSEVKWIDRTAEYYNSYWWRLSIGGSIISTDIESFYSGSQIGYYLNQLGDASRFYEAVQQCENVFDYMKVTDGSTIKDYNDYYGGSVVLEHDSRLTFSWCDCYPVKNSQFGALVDAQPRWNVDTGSFDFTFDGDSVKAGKAANKWGIGFDIECHYKIQGNDGKAVNGSPVAGQTYDGVVYCHLDYDNLNQQQFYNGIYDISLIDILQNGNSFQGGDAGAVLLASLALDPAVREQMQTFILYNDERTMTAEQLRQGLGEKAAWFPQVNLPVDYFPDNIVYSLSECVYEITFYPFNSGLGIKGQTSRMFSNTFTGEHGGTATGAVIPNLDPTVLPDIRPDNSTGTNTNYIYPINPGGGASDYAIAQGSPSNSSASATGGEGGNAVVNVQANPIITFDNGLDTFMDVMNLSKNAETVQKGFWGFFGMFKDNPAAELYRDYFGALPEDFVKFLLACSGICFGLGVFRFVRGRWC